jgi:hypothetical protein
MSENQPVPSGEAKPAPDPDWFAKALQAQQVAYPTLPKKKKVKLQPPAPKFKPAEGVEPISQSAWDQMEGKARWDSIVALRGPDLRNSDTLKWFTTSVIRYKLHQIMRVGGMVNDRLPFVVLPKMHGKDAGNFSASHFIGHINEAACWLNIPRVHVGPEIWAKMLDGHTSRQHITAMIGLESEDPSVKSWAESTIGSSYGMSLEEFLKVSS